VWGVVFILLFTLMSFALIQMEESFDHDDISLMGGNTTTWSVRYLFSGSFLLGFELGVFATIMRLEYLTSHIGEKRSASWTMGVNNSSLFARFSVTVLFHRTVFSFFLPHLWIMRTDQSRSFAQY
jgi:hypothetical protein